MSAPRRSVVVPGLGHGAQPFPIASVRGNLLATSAIHGSDPATGEIAADVDVQVEQAFANLDAVTRAAGGSMDDVVQVLVTLVDKADRPVVNSVWERWFPDSANRPTRNTTERALGGGARCALIAYAWIENTHL